MMHTVIEDPTETVKAARVRRMCGKLVGDAAAPIYGEQLGEALILGTGDRNEAEALHALFAAYDGARSAYAGRILGMRIHPAVSATEYRAKPEETEISEPVDLRTEEQKIEAAKRGSAEWDARLAKLQRWQALIIDSVRFGRETLHDAGDLTVSGRSFVAAMRKLRDVVER
ncbi:hypothetical protein VSX56_07415 [Thioclava sp. CPCC 100088]|uniref:Uncharacterized protein n=2 Tax=Thioclava kandeliae TaxID=3070818 RepID=A0ABV1SFC6_9RHOB